MDKTKTQAGEQNQTGRRPTADDTDLTPEKSGSPGGATIQRARAEPSTSVPAPTVESPGLARAADVVGNPDAGAAGRARMAGAMQGAVGNTRVTRMLLPNVSVEEPLCVQPKLAVSATEDAQEQEADHASEEIVRRMTDPSRPEDTGQETDRTGSGTAGPLPATGSMPSEVGLAVSPEMEDRIQSMRGGGKPLPDETRSAFEGQFGRNFSDVRVHTDDRAEATARNLNARAYTIDQDIVFAPGEYAPQTPEGKRLLAHELTHVAQQRGKGSRRPAIQRQAKWWEEQVSTAGERAIYIRPLGRYHSLHQLLRGVDVAVYPNPSPKKAPAPGRLPEALKKAPGQTQLESYVDARLSFSQWTSKDIKSAIDGIFPSGKDTFVTDKEVDEVAKVVEKHRKKHLNTFSMLQGTEMATCEKAPASDPTCIATMNLAVQRLYGTRVIPRTGEMGPTGTVLESIDFMKKKALTSEEQKFAAAYKGQGKRFQILSDSDVDFTGAGAWLVKTVNAQGEGVHVFLFSACNGYHSVSVLVLKNKSGVSIAWKNQIVGVEQVSSKRFDEKVRELCIWRYRSWVVKEFNRKYKPSPEVTTYNDIKDDPRTPAVENQVKATVIKDIGENLIVKLKPPEVT